MKRFYIALGMFIAIVALQHLRAYRRNEKL